MLAHCRNSEPPPQTPNTLGIQATPGEGIFDQQAPGLYSPSHGFGGGKTALTERPGHLQSSDGLV